MTALVCLSEDLGLWVNPERIESLVENVSSTTICLESGQEIKAHGMTSGAILDAITKALSGEIET